MYGRCVSVGSKRSAQCSGVTRKAACSPLDRFVLVLRKRKISWISDFFDNIGQSRRFDDVRATSIIPPKADIGLCKWHVQKCQTFHFALQEKQRPFRRQRTMESVTDLPNGVLHHLREMTLR